MTASSYEFFPCRVQLMGLPRSNLAATNTSNRFGNSIRPSITKLKGISRNLFGSPDPVEMKNLYVEESERIRSYVLQRYNFDTQMPRKEADISTDKSRNKQNTNNSMVKEEHISNSCSSEMSKYNGKQCKQSTINSNFRHRNSKFCHLSLPAAELHKPYTRQSLLTEQFNTRKNRKNLTKNVCQRDDKIIIFENKNSNRKSEFLQIPQSINLKQSACDVTDPGNELSNSENLNNYEIHGINTNSPIPICDKKNNSTTLSIQIILSTENLS